MAAESRLTIDLDALAANFHALAAQAAGAEVAPVVKADGYGLGAGPVARRLWAEGARSFFVARLSEGEALRTALGDRAATIRVLDGATLGAHARLKAAGLTPVLSTAEQVGYWRGVEAGPVSVHVDTGMNRLGLSLEEAAAIPGVELAMSHLGNAAEPGHPRNAAQLACFREVRARFPDARASLSASAGIFLGPDYRFDMVRPGISLYGGGPRETPDARIGAVVTLDAPILQVRDLKAGDAVGYGAMFTAARPMRVAVVGGGYADGVLRTSHAQAAGWLGGVRLPFLVVTMDMIVVDIGELPNARPGDRVELLGPHAPLDDLAATAGSVAHEILVRISGRAERRYLGEAV
ncbi:MAG TPA: alanine racemase [Caulobacteraceae bacterium]|nr:alanine racemase [Caulobacteraceae bacterium]